MTSAELTRLFENSFQASPGIFRAPGRVNLLGEHTDYNDGFVMPCAIGFSTRVAVAARADRKLVIRSLEFAEQVEFDMDNLPSREKGVWCDYCCRYRGCAATDGATDRGALAGAGRSSDWRGTQFFGGDRSRQRAGAVSLSGTELPLPEVAKLSRRPKTHSSARASESWTSSFPVWARPGTR